MSAKTLRLLLLAVVVTGLSSCFRNYYKAVTVTPHNARQTGMQLDSLSAAGRTLILRNGLGEAYRMDGFRLGADGQTATVTLGTVGADHRLYVAEGVNTNKRYRKAKAEQRQVVNEAHAYMPYDAAAKEGSYALNLSGVQKIDVLKHDAKRSTNSHVLGGIGTAAGALFITLVVALASWRGH